MLLSYFRTQFNALCVPPCCPTAREGLSYLFKSESSFKTLNAETKGQRGWVALWRSYQRLICFSFKLLSSKSKNPWWWLIFNTYLPWQSHVSKEVSRKWCQTLFLLFPQFNLHWWTQLIFVNINWKDVFAPKGRSPSVVLETFTLKSYICFPQLWIYFIFCDVNTDIKGELGLHQDSTCYFQEIKESGELALHLNMHQAE